MAKEIEIRVVVPAGSLRWLLTAALMLWCAGDTVSESVSLTTYYPAPSGIYTQMITASNTWLARDGGRYQNATTGSGVVIGGNAAPIVNSKLTVNAGSIAGTYGLTPSYSNWASYGTGDGGAAIYNDSGAYDKLMIVGNTAAGGAREVGVWDNMTINGNETVTGNGQVNGNMGVGGAFADARLRVTGNVHVGSWNNGGIAANNRGYIYIDNGNTGCWTSATTNAAVCGGGNFASFNRGLYVEGWTYQNRGGAVTVTNNVRNTTKVWAQDPVTLAAGWFTIAKNDTPVIYYCCPK